MLKNGYRRIDAIRLKKVLKINGECLMAIYPSELWYRLRPEHYRMALRMGGRLTIYGYPKFSNVKSLKRWVWWLLQQSDLDEELRGEILKGVVIKDDRE